MKSALFSSSALLLFVSCHADLVFLPKIASGVKKIASDIGIIKTTPSNAKKEEPTTPTTLPETIYNHPASYKPADAFEKPSASPSDHNQPAQPSPPDNKVHSDRIQAVIEDITSGPTQKIEKPKVAPAETNPGQFPPGPASLSSKNNVTAIDKHGNVVFPDDEHKPDATPVTNTLVCEKGKAYPPNDPCGKTLDSKIVCTDGARLDENNQCRPTDL